MVAVPRVPEEHTPIMIAGVGTTDDFENVLIPVVVKVSKRNSVSFLDMTESAGCGYILKVFSFNISEHAVRNEGPKVGISCSDVKVQPTIVVKISEVRSHGVQELGDTGGCAHVAE